MAIGDDRMLEMLTQVRAGAISPDQALESLRHLPYEDLGFAKVDHHRALRDWLPEVILGHGKTTEQVAAIAERVAARSDRLLITRVGPECYQAVREVLPDAIYHPIARTVTVNRQTGRTVRAGVMVVSGGTADMPVAEEAAVTAEMLDCQVERVYDVGVAGIHRLFDQLPLIRQARVIVAVAGMDGALPSVLAGLVSVPVIAVPTSVGYGANFGGLAPLLTMLNSCAAGVAVVNIDNGFGAGYLAALMSREQE